MKGYRALLVAVVMATPLAQSGSLAASTLEPEHYRVPQREGVASEVRTIGDETVFSIRGRTIDNHIVIDLGSMPAEPNKQYRARYRARSPKPGEGATIYLMIREHEVQQAKPTAYHTTDVHYRDLPADDSGAWSERPLTFTTGSNTYHLSAAVVVLKLDGEVQVSSFELLDEMEAKTQARARAEAEYDRLMAEVRAQADARRQLTQRTLVFSRAQMKYGHERNYYHQWNDRPLVVNRDYRVPHEHVTPLPSYRYMLEEAAKYDLDGLAFFPEVRGRMAAFDLHAQAGVEGVMLLPEFLAAFTSDHVDVKTRVLERALQSPYAPRIDGKLLITSYHAQTLSPEQWREILSTLRQRVGDTFIFLPTLTNVVALRPHFMRGEPIPRALIEEKKAYLRSYLEVCDGIYFNYPAAFRNEDHSFDAAFYREVFIPVFKSVLSEPAYRHKYFALAATRSHMSPDRGNSLHEDGTRTLRYSFEAAMAAQPDVMILPEWDEFNENTCWRPTIYGSTTTGRIVRYYMSRIKGKPPTPWPGDDTSVPNLVLSTRKFVTLGEELVVELLNVPDGTYRQPYTATVTLRDAAGRVVHAFGPATFDATRLQEHRFTLATETIPQVRALVPVLSVQDADGNKLLDEAGFHHVQVRATWGWDHLYVKQPIRERLHTESVSLAWQTPPSGDQPGVLIGAVSSPEKLALVEVLGDNDVLYAVDPRDEFFRNDPDREVVLVEYRSMHRMELRGSVTLRHGHAKWIEHASVPQQPPATVETHDDRIELRGQSWVHDRWIALAIPRTDIDAAELVIDFGQDQFTVPVRDALQEKMIARGFDSGLHVTIFPYHRQLDMPFHLDRNEATFQVRVWPEIGTEQYHLQLTSVTGKVFRSAPLLLPHATSPQSTTLRVHSDRQRRGVDLQVDADRVPRLAYDFAPRRGAVLLTDAGRPFWATLGGFTSTTTGQGTINDLYTGAFPAQKYARPPQWTQVDGRPALQFDGVVSSLELPREAIPYRGAYTLELEVRPADDRDMVLLASRTVGSQTGLALEIRGGKLHASFRDRTGWMRRFATELGVEAGAWSAIRVRHDFETIALSVNGSEESFALSGHAYNIGFTVIGPGWGGLGFVGHLRQLSVTHNAQ